MEAAAECGDLATVKSLYEHGEEISQSAVLKAAEHGHCEVVQWVYTYGKSIYFSDDDPPMFMNRIEYGLVMLVASVNGHESLVMWLQNSGVEYTTETANAAAVLGRVDFLTLLKQHGVSPNVSTVMSELCERGLIDVIRYLTKEYPNQISVLSSDIAKASANGHLNVIWHLQSYTTGIDCSSLISAAANGHLNIVEYIERVIMKCSGSHHDSCGRVYTNYCRVAAMDSAAANGQLETVKWFHSKGVRCSDDGFTTAVLNGHLSVVQFLCDHGTVPTFEMVVGMIRKGPESTVEFIISRLPRKIDLFLAEAIRQAKTELVEHICKNYTINRSLAIHLGRRFNFPISI